MQKKGLFILSTAVFSVGFLTNCGGGGGGTTKYTVTFETYGGTPKPADQSIVSGHPAFRPSEEPKIEGDEYTFNDWYVSPTGFEKFDFNAPITADTTVYAHYDGGYTIEGKTNVDYNDYTDENLLFKVKNPSGEEEEGFTFGVYFEDFETNVSIEESTGRLVIPLEENRYLYGYVYAYKENTKKKIGYDIAYKLIHIASFNMFKFTEIESTGNYEVSLDPDYEYESNASFNVCVPEIYYDEDNKVIKGPVTKINGQFGPFLSTADKTRFATIYIADSVEEICDDAFGTDGTTYHSYAYIVHISNAIRKIGARAFKYCDGDYKTTFDFDFSKSKLESIGDQAFYFAYLQKKNVIFPETLTSIGDNSLYVSEYNRPSSIVFNDTKYWVENDTTATMNILDMSNKTQNVNYFSPVSTYTGPKLLKGIQKASFNQGALLYDLGSAANTLKVKGVDTTKLEDINAVTIPETIVYGGTTYTVNEIEAYAFKDKATIVNVYLPDTIEKIGDEAFSGCSALKSIHITKGVTSIGEKVFDNCYSLVSMSVDKDNTKYASYVVDGFYHGAILSKDGTILYYGCKSVADLNKDRTFPQKVKEIKSHAFYGRYNSNDSTSGIKGNITFPSTLTHIEADAFTNAFKFDEYSGSSYKIQFANITHLWTFTNSQGTLDGRQVNDPDQNLTNFESYASYDWRYREEGSENLKYTDYTSAKTSTLESYDSCTDTNVVIPELHNGCKVDRVKGGAFKDKTNITSVSIGNNVNYLGPSAFEGCEGLTSLIIPKSVNRIGDYKIDSWSSSKPVYVCDTNVFKGCTNLTSVYFEDYETKWAYGHYYARQGSIGWEAVFVKDGEIEFTSDPAKNAEILTDYTTEGYLAKYSWQKVGTF